MGLPRSFLSLKRAVHPADLTVLALLTLALVVALVRWPSVGAGLSLLVLVQACLLLGFLACVVVLTRWETRPWVPYVRGAVTVAVVFTLYTSLGKLGVAAMPYLCDAALS